MNVSKISLFLLPKFNEHFDFAGMKTKRFDQYFEMNESLNKTFKYILLGWTSLAVSVGTYPFLFVLLDFVTGKYDKDSWVIIYNTF